MNSAIRCPAIYELTFGYHKSQIDSLMSAGSAHDDDPVSRLKTLRSVLAWSQRRIARELGVAPATVAQWETRVRRMTGPAVRLVDILLQRLGMPLDVDDSTRWANKTLRRYQLSSPAHVKPQPGAPAMRTLFASHLHAQHVQAASERALLAGCTQVFSRLLGLTAKVEQVLASSGFPTDAGKLHTRIQTPAPRNYQSVRRLVETQLGARIDSLFSEFSPTPCARGTIGQVHKARTQDGHIVAVKLQYPDMASHLDQDFARLARLEGTTAGVFRKQAPGVVLGEVRDVTMAECDYNQEAAWQTRFAQYYQNSDDIRIAPVWRQLSSATVLTTGWIDGEKLDDFVAQVPQHQRNCAGQHVHRFYFESLLAHNLLHADPHPQNFRFSPQATSVLDFGTVRQFDDDTVDLWCDYVSTFLDKKPARADELAIAMGVVRDPDTFDFEAQRSIMRRILEPWLCNRPYRFERYYVRNLWSAAIVHNPNLLRTNLEPRWVFFNRLQWGMYSILAELGSEVHWRPLLDRLLSERRNRPQVVHS